MITVSLTLFPVLHFLSFPNLSTPQAPALRQPTTCSLCFLDLFLGFVHLYL